MPPREDDHAFRCYPMHDPISAEYYLPLRPRQRFDLAVAEGQRFQALLRCEETLHPLLTSDRSISGNMRSMLVHPLHRERRPDNSHRRSREWTCCFASSCSIPSRLAICCSAAAMSSSRSARSTSRLSSAIEQHVGPTPASGEYQPAPGFAHLLYERGGIDPERGERAYTPSDPDPAHRRHPVRHVAMMRRIRSGGEPRAGATECHARRQPALGRGTLPAFPWREAATVQPGVPTRRATARSAAFSCCCHR
jgi:hypothetical protein